jgi:multidrug efflux system outer membrane protein
MNGKPVMNERHRTGGVTASGHAIHEPTHQRPPSAMTSSTRSPFRRRALLLPCLAAALLAAGGCATRIETTRPALELPAAWAEARPEADAGAQALERDWWRGFRSDELVALIDQAQAGSANLIVAAERVRQAELAARLAGSSLFPQVSVGGDTGARYNDTPGPGNSSTQRSTSVSVGISYEIDLWGRVAALDQGAQASLRGSRYDLETVRLSLTTGVANAYFQVLSLRMRLAVARENLEIAEKVRKIVDARYRNGVATALDLSRQRTTVLTQRTALLPLEVQERQSISALAILLGRPPQGFGVQGTDLTALAVPEVAAGLPSSLLTRRPDLASAEAQLAGADANLAAARAALLPTLSLTSAAGMSNNALLSLANPAFSLDITASILRTLFDADRQRNQIQVSESSRRQMVETYRLSVYTALKEMDDALGNAARNRAQEDAQQVIREEAQRSLRLSELRYREGADDLSALLDAQRTLFSAEDQLAQVKLSRLTAALDVFKALGGGWTRPTP